jgi:nucleotide-binding universal stress UspA family protein
VIDLHQVLVPTDFSQCSKSALVYGVALADRFGARLHLLHVVQDLALFIPDMVMVAPPVAPSVTELKQAALGAFDRLIADNKLDPAKLVREVREGAPFYEILEYAKEANIDLIVMGTHGHTGLAHVLLGSVTAKIVRQAPCPVLTVHHPEHEFVHP